MSKLSGVSSGGAEAQAGTRNDMIQELLSGGVSRREFVRYAALLGVSASTLSAVLAACSTGPQPSTVDTSIGKSRGRTLIIAATGTPSGFDGDVLVPNMQNVIVQMNEPLVDYAPPASGSSEVDARRQVPKLAASWSTSADGKSWTFQLRQGVKSSLGNELTAADVVFGYKKSLSQKRTGLFLATVSNVVDVTATGKYEVTYTLKAPSSVFLPVRTVYDPLIPDSTEAMKHATAADPFATNWFKTNYVGFGPYALESITPGQQAVFVANPNYYGDKPYFTKVIYQAVPDAANRVSLLQTGQVDLIEEPSFSQLSQLKNDAKVKVVSVVGNQIAAIEINPNLAPFTDLRVRQAVAYAIDNNKINRDVFFGLGSVSKSPVPPRTPNSTSEFWHFDLDYSKAKQLLSAAGHTDGLDITLNYAENESWEEALAVSVRDSLANANIRVTLAKLTNDVLSARTAPSAHRDVPMFTWMDYSLVFDAAYTMFNNSGLVGPARRNDWTNAQFESDIEKALLSQDATERAQLEKDAQRIHVQDVSWASGVLIGGHQAMLPGIGGYVWHPDNRPRWVEMKRL
jgi:peptide/nickel transport system substrate-binding protein